MIRENDMSSRDMKLLNAFKIVAAITARPVVIAIEDIT
jgi:hypothetical protein